MKSSEIRKAIYQLPSDAFKVLMYLASWANYNPKGYETKVYWKKLKLGLGQVPPARIASMYRDIGIARYKIRRILNLLVEKGFIAMQTFPRGKAKGQGQSNGKGYSIITVGLISGVSLNASLLCHENKEVMDNLAPLNAPSSYDNKSTRDTGVSREALNEPHPEWSL